jgi:hypothetical protein
MLFIVLRIAIMVFVFTLSTMAIMRAAIVYGRERSHDASERVAIPSNNGRDNVTTDWVNMWQSATLQHGYSKTNQ